MRYLVLICAFTSALAVQAIADPNTGTIYGRVLAAGSGRPLCGVVVTAVSEREAPREARTLNDGSFHIFSVNPGRVRVIVGRSRWTGYVTVSGNLTTEMQPVYMRAGRDVMRCGSRP